SSIGGRGKLGPGPGGPVQRRMESIIVAGVRNLTQVEAAERARLLEVTGYDIALDLTDGSGNPGETTFRSTTKITFRCIEPGAETFVEVAEADFAYSASGQVLRRGVDPVDKEIYLYSQFETADAQRAYACFDQPDLKSVFTWRATVPAHWTVVSNMPVERTEPAGAAAKTVHFVTSARMSTYITALCAGPY